MNLKFTNLKRFSAYTSIFLGLLSFLEAIKLYRYGTGFLIGDHAFPGVIGILLVLAGISLYFIKEDPKKENTFPNGKTRNMMLATIGVLFGYCFVMEYIGYTLATFISFVILIKMIGNYRWLTLTLLAGVFTATLYYVFIGLLKTPLPTLNLF